MKNIEYYLTESVNFKNVKDDKFGYFPSILKAIDIDKIEDSKININNEGNLDFWIKGSEKEYHIYVEFFDIGNDKLDVTVSVDYGDTGYSWDAIDFNSTKKGLSKKVNSTLKTILDRKVKDNFK